MWFIDNPSMEDLLFHVRGCSWLAVGLAFALMIWCFATRPDNWPPLKASLIVGSIIALGTAYWIATTPVPWDTGNDRDVYIISFEWKRDYVTDPAECFKTRDPFFQLYQYFISRFAGYKVWLLITALIYTGNYLLASYRFGKERLTALLIAFIAGFGFFTYGINGIRTGLAMSFILLGLSYRKNLPVLIISFLIAVLFHLSMIIPAVAIVLSMLLGKKKVGIGEAVWVAAFIISLAGGDRLMDIVTSLAHGGRTEYLVNDGMLAELPVQYNTGFRWDFIAFSLLPMTAAFFYRYVLKYRSNTYAVTFTTYLLVNALWLLVIRLPFTDRFAYLSWALMPILFFYPLTDTILKIRYKKIFLGVGVFSSAVLFNFVL